MEFKRFIINVLNYILLKNGRFSRCPKHLENTFFLSPLGTRFSTITKYKKTKPEVILLLGASGSPGGLGVGRSVAPGGFPRRRHWPWHSTSGSGSAWVTSLHQHPRASPGILLLLPVAACSASASWVWTGGGVVPRLRPRRAAGAGTRILLPSGRVCSAALEWCRALQPRRAEPVSHRTNASFVSASLHRGMRMQRPEQGR